MGTEGTSQARPAFVENNGISGRWSSISQKVINLATAKRNGVITRILRAKSIDVDVTVNIACASLDETKLLTDIQAKARQVIPGCTATKEIKYTPAAEPTKCSLKVTITFPVIKGSGSAYASGYASGSNAAAGSSSSIVVDTSTDAGIEAAAEKISGKQFTGSYS